MRGLLVVVPLALLLASCSDDGGTEQLTSSLPPTRCATGGFDQSRVVVITVDDIVGGFGGMGSRTPAGLSAGVVRITVEADAENEALVTVLLTRDGTQVAAVSGVPAGSSCSLDVELAAGHYVATEGDRDVEFDVVAGAG
jgi:hypothetical protein